MQIQLLDLPSIRSPINYPGGKRRSWKLFKELLPSKVERIISPFCGGAALELRCASNGIPVLASDASEPLINFWKHYQKDSNELIDIVLDLFPLSWEETTNIYENQLKINYRNVDGKLISPMERAAYYLLMNRQSFKGLTLAAKPQFSYAECNANVPLFKKLRNWNNSNISFQHCDYKDALESALPSDFVYLDPPYVGHENLYACEFDHREFYEVVRKLDNQWILSYKEDPLIFDLYQDYRIVKYKLIHLIGPKSGAKIGQELFISNF